VLQVRERGLSADKARNRVSASRERIGRKLAYRANVGRAALHGEPLTD